MSVAAADAFMSIFGMKRVKPEACKVCTAEFTPQRMGQKTCADPVCRTEWKRQIEMRKQALREKREQKERLKTRQDWLKEAQSVFNSFIRERDRDLPCISCGRHHTGSYDAGHYRSVGAAPQLRFDERNVHKQCVPCNQYKSGNAIEYRLGLSARIGSASVELLEASNEIKRWTIDEAKEIKATYKAKLKELKSAVLDHPTHEKAIGGERYGCHNRKPFQDGYFAPNGYEGSRYTVAMIRFDYVPHTMSTECRYDQSLSDPKCSECKHAGSGEKYAEGVRLNGT